MESIEFDEILTRLGIGTSAAARELQELGGGKTSAGYVSAMRNGRKSVSQSAAIYARMKVREAEAVEHIPDGDLLEILRGRLLGQG